MSAKNSRSGANKLNFALESFEQSLNQDKPLNNKPKLAIKALREVFGQSLKITSQSSHDGDYLTQSVAFAINVGKFDELLAEQSLTSTIQALELISPKSLPSRTLHNMATVEALCLMGFDVELPSTQNTASAHEKQSPSPSVNAVEQEKAPESDDTHSKPSEDYPSSNAAAMGTTSESEDSNEESNISLPVENLTDKKSDNPDNDDKQSGEKIPTENQENALSRTDQLNKMLDEQELPEVDDNSGVKKVSAEIIEKIIESMRELDLSEMAVLSRLRNTTAKSIHDLTQPEGYRITNWLNASKVDSPDIIKKRHKLGSFKQHLPTDKSKTVSSEVTVTQNKHNKEQASVSQQNSNSQTADPSTNPESTVQTKRDVSLFAKKALDSYLREKETTPLVSEFALEVIKEITGISTTVDDIEDLITELEDKEAKRFRARLSAMILTNN